VVSPKENGEGTLSVFVSVGLHWMVPSLVPLPLTLLPLSLAPPLLPLAPPLPLSPLLSLLPLPLVPPLPCLPLLFHHHCPFCSHLSECTLL